MIEQQFSFTLGNEKSIERIIDDDHVTINHMILVKSESLPEHNANSNVHLIIIRGQLSIRLDEQAEHQYPAGSIIAVPFKTKMNISNQAAAPLEFFVIKAPSPRRMTP